MSNTPIYTHFKHYDRLSGYNTFAQTLIQMPPRERKLPSAASDIDYLETNFIV